MTTPWWAGCELEALARLDAARGALDAVLLGNWLAEPDVLAAVAELVHAAGFWLAAGCHQKVQVG